MTFTAFYILLLILFPYLLILPVGSLLVRIIIQKTWIASISIITGWAFIGLVVFIFVYTIPGLFVDFLFKKISPRPEW